MPHEPDVLDTEGNSFSLTNILQVGYLGNLVLADRYLGEVRRSMERAGVWDDSAVLVTSDHEWRDIPSTLGKRTRKLVFLLKLPGVEGSTTYDNPIIPMLLTRDLLLELMAGRLSTAEAVSYWLDARSREQDHSARLSTLEK